MKTIFVQIASYRDSECRHTIADLFAKAASPARVFVGVCEQLGEGDEAWSVAEQPRVRVVRFKASEAKGAGWARNKAQKLYNGEDYVLQIQAHMRFEAGWDDTLIEMLEALPTQKAVLTAWLPNYTPPNRLEKNMFPIAIINRLGGENDAQLIHLIKRTIPLENGPEEPFLTGMWVGNFLFCRADTIREIPSDPHMYFWGEEPNYSARLWTHGYDIYHLNKIVLYHYWDRVAVPDAEIYRDHGIMRNRLSLMRNRYVLGLDSQVEDDAALEEIEQYPLGSARSLADYWKFIGVDLSAGEIGTHARLGEFIPLTERLDKIFVQIASYRDPELSATITDLFSKAAHASRVFVGVCEQFNDDDDEMVGLTPSPHIKIIRVKATDSKGANWARAQAQSLWRGEEYVLQIDSHMRFEKAWDEMLIDMLERAPSKRAVISGYLPNYTPPDACDESPGHILRMKIRKLGERDDPQLVHLTGEFIPFSDARAGLCQTPFIIANNIFGRADIWRDIPIDPHIYFHGDEISFSARLWTHGVDVFEPDKTVLYHYWARHSELAKHPYRNTRAEPAQLTRKRILQLLGLEKCAEKNALENLAYYGLGNARLLTKFWQFAKLPFAQNPPRIFVRIASYRDTECQYTVADLFAKAANPERITVGICWQFDREHDAECFKIITRPKQVKIIAVDWRESEGVCWARAQTETLWSGEEYTLQIDSHMRFVEGWDEKMIAELALCGADKPVLSSSPAKYIPPNDLEENPLPTVRRVLPFTANGNLRGRGEFLERAPEKPLRGAFVAAGFVFSSSEILREVPYDPMLYFDQEEIMYALRLFTHGWQVFSPRSQLLYHYYNEGENARPLHWDDLKMHDAARLKFYDARGLARFNHLTGFRPCDDKNLLRDIEKYGFGDVRSMREFEDFTGIDFVKKTVSDKTLNAKFIENITHYRSMPMVEVMLANRALQRGDVLPMFMTMDSKNQQRSLEERAGKSGIVFFLPADKPAFLQAFFATLSRALAAHHKPDCTITFVLNASVEALVQLRTQLPELPQLWADEGGRIATILGAASMESGELIPTAFVFAPNLQIQKTRQYLPVAMLVEEAVACVSALLPLQNTAPIVITQSTPAQIIPNALDERFCQKLIAEFHAGDTFKGFAGAGEKVDYYPNAKRRVDFLPDAALLAEIDEQLARSVFPCVEKQFGFAVRYRERYKIGMYSASDGGFFRAHRDNFEPALAHRRIAMTIVLADDYEGGGLRFPEYGEAIFCPPAGSAIVFPCAHLHEALPVTRGLRYVLLGFFHGEVEEKFRVDYLKKQGEAPQGEEYRLPEREHFGVRTSRDFYRDFFLKKP